MRAWKQTSKVYLPAEMSCMCMIWLTLYRKKPELQEEIRRIRQTGRKRRQDGKEIRMNPIEGVRYTVPGTINVDRMDENLTLRFRVGGVYKNCYISAYFDDERVIHRKRPVVAPGEMEEIKLTKEEAF